VRFEEQARARAEQAGDRVEQAAGDVTADRETKDEGTLDEAEGKLRAMADKAREAIHDATAHDR
jgi:uncharacterized protein YjbJ (UPF0337 family)